MIDNKMSIFDFIASNRITATIYVMSVLFMAFTYIARNLNTIPRMIYHKNNMFIPIHLLIDYALLITAGNGN